MCVRVCDSIYFRVAGATAKRSFFPLYAENWALNNSSFILTIIGLRK